MKSIVSRAPAVAVLLAGGAFIAAACGGSQKELTAPQQAAAQAEDQAQKAQEEAQKAREEANKTQKDLAEAQQSHDEARKAELSADQRAQVATRQAQIAEQQASQAAQPPAPAPAQGAQPQQQKGVAEAQAGPHPGHDSSGKLVIITASLLFPSNSAELLPSSKPKLDEVAGALNAQPQANKVKVQGYTDSTGSVAVNEALSQKRAQAVADYLQSKGVSPDRISAEGFGDQDPVSLEKNAEGRALNRRVDLVVEPAEGRANTQAPDNGKQQQPGQQQQQQQQQQQPKQQP